MGSVPQITSLSPAARTAGSSAFELRILGSDFLSSSTVTWTIGTTSEQFTPTFVSSTELRVNVPASLVATAGSASLVVSNHSTEMPSLVIESEPATFPINLSVPNLTALTPSSATSGGPGFTLDLIGTGFVADAIVQWDGTARTTTFISDTELQAGITANDLAGAGTATVSVVQSGGTASKTMTVRPPIPGPATSRYLQTVDPTRLYDLGCEQGAAREDGAAMLDFGQPAANENGLGTTLYDANGTFVSLAQIEAAAYAFMTGYYACAGGDTALLVVIGPSNQGPGLTAAHGAAWGAMIARIEDWSEAYIEHVYGVGGLDVSSGWNSPGATRAWLEAHQNSAAYYSPTYVGDAGSSGGWSAGAVYSIIGGAYTYNIAKVFYPGDAGLWAGVIAYGQATCQCEDVWIMSAATNYAASGDPAANDPASGYEQLKSAANGADPTTIHYALPFYTWTEVVTDFAYATAPPPPSTPTPTPTPSPTPTPTPTSTPTPGPNAPPAPTQFHGGTVTDNGVQLLWSASGTIDRFEILFRVAGTPTWSTVTLSSGTATSWTHTSVSPGTTYEYQMRACSGTDCSAWVGPLTVETAPLRPTNLRSGTITPTSIQVLWDDTSGSDTGFELRHRVSTTSTWTTESLSPETTSWTDTGLSLGSTYYYDVRICKGTACSNWTTDLIVKIGPTAPTNLRAGAVTGSSIEILWADNATTEVRYEVEHRAAGTSTWTAVTLGANVAAWTDTGLSADSGYEYRVRACDIWVCSAWAGPVTITTAPTPATSLQAGTVTTSSIDLAWTDTSANETAFELQYRLSGTTTWTSVLLAANTTAWTHGGLTGDSTYEYQVRACADTACSGWAGPLSVQSGPVMPANVRAGTVTATSIQVLWDDASNSETAYELRHRVSTTATWTTETLAANTTTWTDTGLTLGKTYYYSLRACRGTICSNWTATLTVQIGPTAPSNVRAGVVTDTSIEVQWNDNASTETSQELQYRPNGTTPWTTVTLAANVTSWTHTGLTADRKYDYQVRACDAWVCSAWSSVKTLATTPAAPTNLHAGTVTSTSIQLLWNDNSTVNNKVEIQYRLAGTTTWTTVMVSSGTATSWTQTGRTAATSYEYQIRSCFDTSCSAWVGPITITTLP